MPAPPQPGHTAFICGGYPEGLRKVTERLNELGINVSGFCDNQNFFSVPSRTSFILVLADQCRHSVSVMARDAADKMDIPIVAGSAKNWHEIVSRLRNRGLVGPPLQPVEEFHTTLGEKLAPEKLAELQAKLSEAPPPPAEAVSEVEAPSISEPTVATTQEVPTSPAIKLPPAKDKQVTDRNRKAVEAIYQVLEVNKDKLATTCNWELADDVKKSFGISVSESSVGDWRRAWKYPVTPAGFKKARRGRGKRVQPRPSVKAATSSTSTKQTESEFDVIQSLLNEWVAKFAVSKVSIEYINGAWKVDWEQVAITSHSKKY